jgi:hypothetical protein
MSTLKVVPTQKLFGSTGSAFDSTNVDKILVKLYFLHLNISKFDDLESTSRTFYELQIIRSKLHI